MLLVSPAVNFVLSCKVSLEKSNPSLLSDVALTTVATASFGYLTAPSWLDMAAQFIGSTVIVTLHSPPRAQIKGRIGNIHDGQLSLNNGMRLFQI